MNCVSLIGTLADEPKLVQGQSGVDVCVMRIAVPRRDHGGRREPGVVYVDLKAFGTDAREAERRLRRGDRIGLSGRIEHEELNTAHSGRLVDHAVLIEQLDLPTPTASDPEEESR